MHDGTVHKVGGMGLSMGTGWIFRLWDPLFVLTTKGRHASSIFALGMVFASSGIITKVMIIIIAIYCQ